VSVHTFTLYDMLMRNAAQFGGRPAVIHEQGQVDFRAFLGRVDALAAGLAALPIHKGERLCILAQNHPSYLDLYGACAKLGILAYPVNWRLTPDEIRRVVERAEPSMMVVDDTTRPAVADWPASTPIAHWYTFGSTPSGSFSAFDVLYPDAVPADTPGAVAGDGPFAVISTAAVDVIPRGAVLTHNNLLAANLQTMACMGLTESDCNLLALPLFHVAALGAAFATMHAGGANVLTARFDAAQAVKLIDAHNVTYLTSFPPVLSSILDAADTAGSRLHSLKHVAGLEGPAVIGRLHANTQAQFWTGYGQTETSGFITLQRAAERPGAAGRVAPLCRVRLTDEYDREVPTGTPGEILARGPVVFQGYFAQPQETDHTFRGGWHHTGDVGRFDEDGFLHYVGRRPEKELIKPGGENVYPAEVETVIMEIPGVNAVCVFGVPDAQWGEAIKAVVESGDRELSPGRVIDHVAARIARYKKPQWVVLTDILPRTDTHEVDREAVKSRWGQEA
jgi:acyl-CoA synthetase (AMP-forming)/AMP-acid ligase II